MNDENVLKCDFEGTIVGPGKQRIFCCSNSSPISGARAFKGQMHHHDDLGSKCAYMCHLSNKTTRKSVLLSTPQIWLMKVSKKLAWVWV